MFALSVYRPIIFFFKFDDGVPSSLGAPGLRPILAHMYIRPWGWVRLVCIIIIIIIIMPISIRTGLVLPRKRIKYSEIRILYMLM